MKKQGRLFLLAVCFLLAMQGCQEGKLPDVQDSTEWIARSEYFEQNYTLDQLVVLSRHNIRSPLVSKNSVLTRLTNPDYYWFPWEGTPSHLTITVNPQLSAIAAPTCTPTTAPVIYNARGQRTDKMARGLNIVKTGEQTRKILVK